MWEVREELPSPEKYIPSSFSPSQFFSSCFSGHTWQYSDSCLCAQGFLVAGLRESQGAGLTQAGPVSRMP